MLPRFRAARLQNIFLQKYAPVVALAERYNAVLKGNGPKCCTQSGQECQPSVRLSTHMHACTHACMSSHKHTHTYEHTHTHLNSSTQQQTHEEGTEEEVETKKMKTKVRDTEADRHITPLYEFTHTPEEEPDEHHAHTHT